MKTRIAAELPTNFSPLADGQSWVGVEGAWPSVPFSSVRAYFYNPTGSLGSPLLHEGELHSTVFDPTGVELERPQKEVLRLALFGDHPTHPVAACHRPRHGFVLFDSLNSPVASVEICFECLTHRFSPVAQVGNLDWSSLRTLIRDAGLPLLDRPEDYLALKPPSFPRSAFRLANSKPNAFFAKLP